MKKLFYFLLLLGVSHTAFAQVGHSIYDTHQYNKGIYKSFEEFRNNEPSQTGNIVIKGKTTAAQFYLLSAPNELYAVDNNGKEHKIKKYWGYCDGTNLYVRDNGLQKIEEVGYYCLYQVRAIPTSTPNSATAGMVFSNTPPAVVTKKVIDLSTGTVYGITLYNMKKYILPKDTALTREFYQDPNNKERLIYYIQKFNQRNTPNW
ncbi:hypothetical protein [Chitinophaga sancti]|nr:hypothetical protein [Chitinophaga sancti]WQD60446.1 hypothetical protein U0033_21370 [Chitinophaga sancti]WQG87426.1 hypothetical protein SR876_21100 [Chitinophaga sancti]